MSFDEQAIVFEQIDMLLRGRGLDTDAAECHGVLCGLLCTLDTMDDALWSSCVLAGKVEAVTSPAMQGAGLIPDELLATDRSLLIKLYHQTRESLTDPDYRFYPLLPGNDVSLSERTQAMARWCEGFLFGLGLGGVQGDASLTGEAHEAMRDMVEISRLGHEGGEDSEDDENAYEEIVEYLRIATLMICEELRALRTAQPAGPSVH